MSNNYFNELVKRKKNYLFLRKHRNSVKGLFKSFKYAVGDILKVTYNIKNFYLVFEGICISLKNKNFLSLNTVFILRTIILGIGVEMSFSYFCNRLYSLRIQDYKRKFNVIRRSRLFFIRHRKHKYSKVAFT
jgi:ribosomal protein L19